MDWYYQQLLPSLRRRLGREPDSIRAHIDPNYFCTDTDSDDLPEIASLFESPAEDVCKFGEIILVVDNGLHPIQKIKVSATAMATGSPFFRKLFFGDFAEAIARRQSHSLGHPEPIEITIRDDPAPFLTLCKMLHHHADAWREDNLLDVAILIDKYDLADSLQPAIYAALARKLHVEPYMTEEQLYDFVAVAYLCKQKAHFRMLTARLIFKPEVYKLSPKCAQILPSRLIGKCIELIGIE